MACHVNLIHRSKLNSDAIISIHIIFLFSPHTVLSSFCSVYISNIGQGSWPRTRKIAILQFVCATACELMNKRLNTWFTPVDLVELTSEEKKAALLNFLSKDTSEILKFLKTPQEKMCAWKFSRVATWK